MSPSNQSKKIKAITASGPTEIEEPEGPEPKPITPDTSITPEAPQTKAPAEPKITLEDVLKNFNERLLKLEGSEQESQKRLMAWMDKVEAALKAGPPPQQMMQQPARANDPFRLIVEKVGDAIDKGIVGGGESSLDETYKNIGKRFFDTTLDTAIRRVVKQMGGETAEHMTLG